MIDVLCFADGKQVDYLVYHGVTDMSELEGRFCSYPRYAENLRAGKAVCECYDHLSHKVFYLIDCKF